MLAQIAEKRGSVNPLNARRKRMEALGDRLKGVSKTNLSKLVLAFQVLSPTPTSKLESRTVAGINRTPRSLFSGSINLLNPKQFTLMEEEILEKNDPQSIPKTNGQKFSDAILQSCIVVEKK